MNSPLSQPLFYFLCGLLYLSLANQVHKLFHCLTSAVEIMTWNLSEQCSRSSKLWPFWGSTLTLLVFQIHLAFSKQMRPLWSLPGVRVHSKDLCTKPDSVKAQINNLKLEINYSPFSPNMLSFTEVKNSSMGTMTFPSKLITMGGRGVKDLWIFMFSD